MQRAFLLYVLSSLLQCSTVGRLGRGLSTSAMFSSPIKGRPYYAILLKSGSTQTSEVFSFPLLINTSRTLSALSSILPIMVESYLNPLYPLWHVTKSGDMTCSASFSDPCLVVMSQSSTYLNYIQLVSAISAIYRLKGRGANTDPYGGQFSLFTHFLPIIFRKPLPLIKDPQTRYTSDQQTVTPMS